MHDRPLWHRGPLWIGLGHSGPVPGLSQIGPDLVPKRSRSDAGTESRRSDLRCYLLNASAS